MTVANPVAPARETRASGFGLGRVSDALDLNGLIAVFRRRLRLTIATVVAVFLLVVLVTFLITPIYASTAEIKLDLTQRSPLDIAAATTGAPPDQSLVDTEVAIMKSPDVAMRVVRQLNLTQDPEFGVTKPPGLFGRPHRPPPPAIAEQITSDAILRNLKVERDGATYIVDLTFRSESPAKAAAIANGFAREYLTSSLQTQLATSSQQAQWLNQRLASLGAEVQAADNAVAQYRARTGIATGGGSQTVTDQQIAPISASLASAASEAAAARSNVQAAREQISKGGLESVGSVLNSNVIADLRRQRAEVLRSQAEINARYGPRHPESVKVQQQIDGLDKSIREESTRIVSGLESDARAAAARAASLQGNLSSIKGAQAGDTRASVEADSLQRVADAKRAVYTQVAQTAQQMQQQQHLDETRARIITQGQAPLSPSFPNVKIFAALGLVLGLIVATALVFVLETLDSSVRTVSDVEDGLETRFISSLPKLTKAQLQDKAGRRIMPSEFVVEKPMSGYAEALRSARSALLLSLDGERPKILTVTSALPNEGKTSTAIALARVFAMSEGRVLLIDGDLRRNALGRLVDMGDSPGLIEVLTGKVSAKQAIVRDAVPGVDIMPLRKVAFTPRDVFGTDAMRLLLQEVSAQYDQVIIDAPPVLAVTDARTLAKLSDAVLMVVKWRSTARQAVQAALARLHQDGSPVAGVVLSMVDTQAAGALSTHDPAFYYGKYASYYQE